MNHKKFIQYSTLIFLFLGFFLLLAPKTWFPAFYHPTFLGALFLLSPVLIYLPVLFLKKHPETFVFQVRSRITLALFVNTGGELGLFKMNEVGFEYDKFAHFFVCMLFAYSLGEYLLEKRKLCWKKTFFRVLGLMFLAGILWEVFEAVSDLLFHTQEWGVYGQAVFSDTYRDVFFNFLGILSALIVLRIPRSPSVSPEILKNNSL